MAGKIKSFLKGVMNNIKPNAIDYMSINRLRTTISANSELPFAATMSERTLSFTRILDNTLGGKVSFDTMRVYPDPFGICPLSALLYFTSDTPCQVRYSVLVDENAESLQFLTGCRKGVHFIPVFGLLPEYENKILVELLAPDMKVLASRTLTLQTPALPDIAGSDHRYPCIKDARGAIRYFLQLPLSEETVIPLKGGQFLAADARCQTLMQGQFYPTHLYEMDALGCVMRTFYIGNGIVRILGEKEDNGNLLIETIDPSKEDVIELELDRTTGNPVRTSAPSGAEISRPAAIDPELLARLCKAPLIEKLQEYGDAPFTTVGWLHEPVPYKGASIETSAAVELSYLKDTYDLSFYISGDTLMIETTGDKLQGVVFSNNDRIYQLDLTAAPLEDEDAKEHRYTLAVPFTEMFSGTYTIVVRFQDGGQETLAETITLSRSRNF